MYFVKVDQVRDRFRELHATLGPDGLVAALATYFEGLLPQAQTTVALAVLSVLEPPMPVHEIDAITDRLGGPKSAGKYLNVVSSTVHPWRTGVYPVPRAFVVLARLCDKAKLPKIRRPRWLRGGDTPD